MNWNFLKLKEKLWKRQPELEVNVENNSGESGWYRVCLKTSIREGIDLSTRVLQYLPSGRSVHVVHTEGRRAKIDLPQPGWVSLRSANGTQIFQSVVNKTPLLPMPSDLFASNMSNLQLAGEHSDDEEESDATDPDYVSIRLKDREICIEFINKACGPDDLFKHFQTRHKDDLHKIHYFYCGLLSAFVGTVQTNQEAPIIHRKHVEKALEHFLKDPTEFHYGWGDFQLRCEEVLKNFEIFENVFEAGNQETTVVGWGEAPLARAALEFRKRVELGRTQAPDAVQLYQLDDSNGLYILTGYYNMKPLYVREDGLRCIRWFQDSWYVDDEPQNSDGGYAKLEANISHPAKRNKEHWLRDFQGQWRKSSKIRVVPVTFSEHAL